MKKAQERQRELEQKREEIARRADSEEVKDLTPNIRRLARWGGGVGKFWVFFFGGLKCGDFFCWNLCLIKEIMFNFNWTMDFGCF